VDDDNGQAATPTTPRWDENWISVERARRVLQAAGRCFEDPQGATPAVSVEKGGA